jgi:asparagine synthase (glutamine-hydrolysing)
MCGIAGLVGPCSIDDVTLDAARDLMVHRGPDGGGSMRADNVWLASRRLAVIGLGPSGDQPLRHDATGTMIVFNGEIYNYRELRRILEAEGHRFDGSSDTEVVLHAYLRWGPEYLSRLNGMWSLAIWDPRRAIVHLARDRFGVKPLFWTRQRGLVAFASEPKVLLALFPEVRKPDEASLYDLVVHKRVLNSDRSFYAGIKVFPKAHWAALETGTTVGEPRLNRYWTVPEELTESQMSRAEAEAEFGRLFEDAVRLRLRSDVPLGVTLSGGLDSTAILTAARAGLDHDRPLVAYTSVYGKAGRRHGDDERDWARRAIAPMINVELRDVEFDATDWIDDLRRIVWHMDGPGFSPAVLPLSRIAEQSRMDGIKVLLEGQGADETLGGYSWHQAAASVDIARGVLREPRLSSLGALGEQLVGGMRQSSAPRFASEVLGCVSLRFSRWDHDRHTLGRAWRHKGNLPLAGQRNGSTDALMRARLQQDFSSDLLPCFLHYGDAVMMAHSVENRLPFMDYRLVEHACRMPVAHKVARGESKAPLRQYLRSHGQSAVASRKRKQGYPTPVNLWMAADGAAAIRSVLGPGARINEYIDRSHLDRAVDRHVAGHFAVGDVLFALVSAELWLEECC